MTCGYICSKHFYDLNNVFKLYPNDSIPLILQSTLNSAEAAALLKLQEDALRALRDADQHLQAVLAEEELYAEELAQESLIDWTDSDATPEQFKAYREANHLIVDMLPDRISTNSTGTWIRLTPESK